MTYKQEIRELVTDNPDLTGSEIADKVGCSRQYALEVKRNVQTTGSDEQGGGGGVELDLDDTDDGDADLADDDPLSELVMEDEYDEYECGNCEAPVEYLQDECDECGEELAWWSDE